MSEHINPEALPSGSGCLECLNGDGPGFWVHLRRCAQCGHIGCCDSSPSQHARGHYHSTGHLIIRSFEPAEDWFFNFETEDVLLGPALAAPDSRPVDQPVPGPEGKVPENWQELLHN